MREGVETGYEGKWDFAPYPGPIRPYLLATVPRTGSTFLSHLLWESGCLGAPLEYLNFEPGGPQGDASLSPERQAAYWQHALTRRVSPNGVFGLKAFPLQLEELGQMNPPLLRHAMLLLLTGEAPRVVQLRRRDREAHAISYARAMLSGIWRAEQEEGGRSEPGFDARMLEQATRLIDAQEGAWQAMYADLRLEPLVVWYEDAVADGPGTLAAVAEFVGVELVASAATAVPEIKRQSQEGAQAWKDALGG